jgi:hypothetical protein
MIPAELEDDVVLPYWNICCLEKGKAEMIIKF